MEWEEESRKIWERDERRDPDPRGRESQSDSPLSSLVSACASPSASSGPLWSRSVAIMAAQVPHKSDKKSGEQMQAERK